MRRLIVNADDFGRSAGVNAGILEAHARGIVTSATVMVTARAAPRGIREALAHAPRLALGLHFVLTGGGAPLSDPRTVPALAPGGRFPRRPEDLPAELPPDEVRSELDAQVARFRALAGRPPTHLDSHHHVAAHASVVPAFAGAAWDLDLPVRAIDDVGRRDLRSRGVRTPDHFIGAFHASGATRADLERLLAGLREGTTELMCHPGRVDAELSRSSTYVEDRERELAILCDPRVRECVREARVALVAFDAL